MDFSIYKKCKITVLRLHYTEAKGPTWARFLIQQEYSGEKYNLQIDSHTRFEENWDIKLIEQLNMLPEKSCLTQYLPEYNIDKEIQNKSRLRNSLVVKKISALDGFTRINSEYITIKDYKTPFKSNAYSGCFAFSNGNINYDAPIDPYTPNLFFGEEMDITLRLYTRGWNFYSPSIPIAYTNFSRDYRNTFWKGNHYKKELRLLSRLRVHYSLCTLPGYIREIIETKCPELLIDLDNFELGTDRTVYDYSKLIGFYF